MNWKNRYLEPYVGKKYKLRLDSDKSKWNIYDIEERYAKTYTIIRIVKDDPHGILIESANGEAWHMGKEFLEEHFKGI